MSDAVWYVNLEESYSSGLLVRLRCDSDSSTPLQAVLIGAKIVNKERYITDI